MAARPPAVVLDGLIGYSLAGAPFGKIAELIRWANSLDAPIDAPSGLDATTGSRSIRRSMRPRR